MKEIMVKNPCVIAAHIVTKHGVCPGFKKPDGSDLSNDDVDELRRFVEEAAQFWEGKPEIALSELYHKALLYKINKERLSGEAAKEVADVFAMDLYNKLYYQFLYSIGLTDMTYEDEKFNVLTYALLDRKYDDIYFDFVLK